MTGVIIGDIIGSVHGFTTTSKAYWRQQPKARCRRGIVEAFYSSIPDDIKKEGLKRMPKEFTEVISKFNQRVGR